MIFYSDDNKNNLLLITNFSQLPFLNEASAYYLNTIFIIFIARIENT